MKVGIFLKTTGPGEKQRVLLDFAKGVEKVKSDQLLVSSKYEYADCDIAVIFGFFGKNRGNTQNFRKTIYDTHTARKKHCIFIEADPLKYAGKIIAERSSSPVMYFKLPYKSVYYGDSEYFNKNCPPDRWNSMCERKKANVLPYRDKGEHILICMNRGIGEGSRSWSTKGVDTDPWLFKKISQIRKVTNRPIVVRFHPMFRKSKMKHKMSNKVLKFTKDIRVSGIDGKTSLIDDCVNAHAAVVYNTSACVIPLIKGIPLFTDKKDCMAYPIANHNIEKFIEKPKLIDRTQWFYDLAYCLWCKEDMSNGTFWKRFRKFVS
tara:strand:- start:3924 stop:4880 length:957 start_codon:yes stop_codon:yes gene_type:complete